MFSDRKTHGSTKHSQGEKIQMVPEIEELFSDLTVTVTK